jgi:serine/threonine-protein kinase
MGEVYRVVDRVTKCDYAIKILSYASENDKTALDALIKEVSSAQQFTHQNLLSIKYISDRGPIKYFVMEYIDGENLESYRLRKGGVISINEFENIATQLLSGLEYLHSKGVVHLDVKPENIMINKSGEIKITDYGISRTIREQLSNPEHTQIVAGSLYFMSPEQLRLGSLLNLRSDIYSLGIMFYLLLTGRYPFQINSREEITKWHIDNKHILPGISDLGALGVIILKATACNSEERYVNCNELKAEMAHSLHPMLSAMERSLPGKNTSRSDNAEGFNEYKKSNNIKNKASSKASDLKQISAYIALTLLIAFVLNALMDTDRNKVDKKKETARLEEVANNVKHKMSQHDYSSAIIEASSISWNLEPKANADEVKSWDEKRDRLIKAIKELQGSGR